MLTALGVWGINSGTKTATAADTVTYTLPYLTTDTTNPTYCMVSNMGAKPSNAAMSTSKSGDDNVTTIAFTVMASAGGANKTAISTSNPATVNVAKTRLLTISGQTVNLDSTFIIDLSGATGTGTLASYGGTIAFVGSAAEGNPLAALSGTATASTSMWRSTFNCTSIAMTCFQGTTSPKRNLIGYSCSDSGVTFGGGAAAAGNAVSYPGMYAY